MTDPRWEDQQPYQPYGTGPSPYGQGPTGYPRTQQTNGLAIASLSVSVAGLFLCCGFSGIVGAILGHAARRQIRNDPTQTGDGFALGGIIVGWVSFGLVVAGVAVWVALIVLGLSTGSVDCSTSNGTTICS